MSTPCNIAFYTDSEKHITEFEAMIYRHEGGYPDGDGESGVIPDVLPYLKWWKYARGIHDSRKLAARLLQHLCNEYDAKAVQMAEDMGEDLRMGITGVLGYEICSRVAHRCEWFYRVHPCEVRVYKIDGCYPEEEAEAVVVVQI